jgi:hypothetical protein
VSDTIREKETILISKSQSTNQPSANHKTTMSATPINLFAPWNPLDNTDSPDIQDIINYCASRLRAILNAFYTTDHECWLDEGLIVELVSPCLLAALCPLT